MPGAGVTRRHSLTVHRGREDSGTERGVPAPGGTQPPGTKAIRPDCAYGASARATMARASSTIAARCLSSRKLSA
jgi:hypothetical protein